MESSYFDLKKTAEGVAAGRHRTLIGDKWDKIGTLQFEFMKAQGLQPEHRLLDVGCGALRGGIHFVRYLRPGHYFGIDINQAFLDAGYDVELSEAGLRDRLPRENLICNAEFDLPAGGPRFDFALAQSVFTHLSFNRIRQCLTKLAAVMKPGGVFYATYFELPEDAPAGPYRHEQGGKTTHDVRDPYHYATRDLRYATLGLPWTVRPIGDWGHPRGQHMIAFVRDDSESHDQRRLTVDEAAGLKAGSDHYRAYVGPPNRFDFMGATQFSLLFANGLRDHHKVLDFGAGSLRLGRLLIPYLRADRYFAIEPNTWLIDEAVKRELGQDAVAVKRPVFSDRDDFDCSHLGQRFDFIIAQSIVTHCGPDLFARLMRSFSAALDSAGAVLFSYWNTPDELPKPPRDGWIYPNSVKYTETQVERFLQQAGLHGVPIPWYHPGASWYVAALSPERLPSAAERQLLRGTVLFDPQFADSRKL